MSDSLNYRCVEIRVSGRVQGVFFRQNTCETAFRLGISGTVRNLPDGSVFIEAEGESKKMEEFIAFCRKGPLAARVDALEINEAVCKNYSSFQIVRL